MRNVPPVLLIQRSARSTLNKQVEKRIQFIWSMAWPSFNWTISEKGIDIKMNRENGINKRRSHSDTIMDKRMANICKNEQQHRQEVGGAGGREGADMCCVLNIPIAIKRRRENDLNTMDILLRKFIVAQNPTIHNGDTSMAKAHAKTSKRASKQTDKHTYSHSYHFKVYLFALFANRTNIFRCRKWWNIMICLGPPKYVIKVSFICINHIVATDINNYCRCCSLDALLLLLISVSVCWNPPHIIYTALCVTHTDFVSHSIFRSDIF